MYGNEEEEQLPESTEDVNLLGTCHVKHGPSHPPLEV